MTETNIYIDELYDADHMCGLCCANEKVKLLAKQWYYEWVAPKRIALMAQVQPDAVERHAIAYAWDIQRSDNTEGFYRAAIREVGPVALESGIKGIPGKVLVNCARQLDNINGRTLANAGDKEKRIGNLQRTVTLLNGSMYQLVKQKYATSIVMEKFKEIIPEGLLKYLTTGDDGVPKIILPEE